MVKITRETGSTVVEGIEHTLSTTFGIQASETVTKGYALSQNSAGNVAHSAQSAVVGTFVGICDNTGTGSTVAGAKTTAVISHGLVWATAGVGAIVIGNPVKVSSLVGTLSAAIYGTDSEQWIVGTAWSASTSGSEAILVKLK